MTTEPLSEQLERLAGEACKVDDDIRYYSGGPKHNAPAAELAHLVRRNLPTIIEALRAKEGE